MKFDQMRKKMPKTKMLSPGGEAAGNPGEVSEGLQKVVPPKLKKMASKKPSF